jgi:hypothetical protein
VTGSVVSVELIAVLAAVTGGDPRVLTIDGASALPSGPFAVDHRSLQAGLRDWVEKQTHHPLGYVEQLYTFADRDRSWDADRRISISYLGLTREAREAEPGWRSWYRYLPWEDRRDRGGAALVEDIARRLAAWAESSPERRQRVAVTWGLPWNEELVLQRYELLYEACLIPEALRSGAGGGAVGGGAVGGSAMAHDHRRILATAIARLRAKIKYRPVVFELMPPAFTLLQLQRPVEALAGQLLHKQNFRRLIEQQELVEPTGEMATDTGGRPAKLFRFRREVLAERAAAGTKLPLARGP